MFDMYHYNNPVPAKKFEKMRADLQKGWISNAKFIELYAESVEAYVFLYRERKDMPLFLKEKADVSDLKFFVDFFKGDVRLNGEIVRKIPFDADTSNACVRWRNSEIWIPATKFNVHASVD